jgi:hypothetical protein
MATKRICSTMTICKSVELVDTNMKIILDKRDKEQEVQKLDKINHKYVTPLFLIYFLSRKFNKRTILEYNAIELKKTVHILGATAEFSETNLIRCQNCIAERPELSQTIYLCKEEVT